MRAGELLDRFDVIPSRLWTLLGAVASVFLLSLALWSLTQALGAGGVEALATHLRSVSTLSLTLSTICALLCCLVLATVDFAGLRYLRRPLGHARAALISFVANAVGRSVCLAGFGGAAVRSRMYLQNAFSATDISRLNAFISATGVVAAIALFGLSILIAPGALANLPGFMPALTALPAAILLFLPFLYLGIALTRRAPVKLGRWSVEVPTPRVVSFQLGVSLAELLLAAAVLYSLLLSVLDEGFFSFLGIYLVARAAGFLSRVPAGLGIFEVVLIAAYPDVEPAALLGSVIVYRCLYYGLPLLGSLVLALLPKAKRYMAKQAGASASREDLLQGVRPQLMGTLVFCAGFLLLVFFPDLTRDSAKFSAPYGLQPAVLELSHLVAGIAGVVLLFFAQGLSNQCFRAYVGTLAALSIAIVVLIVTGFSYTGAVGLSTLAVAIFMSRGEFSRPGLLEPSNFSVRWVAAIVAGILLALWVDLASFRNVAYANSMWTEFSIDAVAPRNLRTAAVTTGIALLLGISVLARRVSASTAVQDQPENLDRVRALLPAAQRALEHLALLGDKSILWSADRQAFLMYRVAGNSWIAIGDPAGTMQQREELVQEFVKLARRHCGRPVFYLAGEQSRSLYISLGLAFSMVGEEARVNLAEFSVDSSDRAELRNAHHDAKKCGAQFEIVPRARVPSLIGELRKVSDSWLANKYAIEKRFSMGAFSASYIAEFDCAVVTVDGEIVAFANIWPAPAGREIALDIARFDDRAPRGILDFIFVEAMLLAKASGYEWFSLGMVPFSGPEQQPLATVWHKLDPLMCGHGENFYNFEKLRQYKARYSPGWRPRYLASPAGWWTLPQVLNDMSQMISGGVDGMFVRT